MVKAMVRFLKDEEGATAIEYGLIAALISVAIIIGAGLVGTGYRNVPSALPHYPCRILLGAFFLV